MICRKDPESGIDVDKFLEMTDGFTEYTSATTRAGGSRRRKSAGDADKASQEAQRESGGRRFIRRRIATWSGRLSSRRRLPC